MLDYGFEQNNKIKSLVNFTYKSKYLKECTFWCKFDDAIKLKIITKMKNFKYELNFFCVYNFLYNSNVIKQYFSKVTIIYKNNM